MNSIVIYASHSGNTHRIAEAIADGLGTRGSVQLLAAEEAPVPLPADTDLVVIGSPTEGHRMIAPVAEFLARLGPDALRGTATAAFDTRLHGPRWLWGSAASGIAEELRQRGARIVVPAESFYVDMKPHLQEGEIQRAAAWARTLADTLAATLVAAR
jgi:flavodoxin